MTNRPDALLFNAITPRASAVEQKIKNFLTKWPPVRQKLPFPEMAEMRITPEHPEYKKIQDEAFLMLLDGKLRSHTEIVKFLEPYSPPEPPPPPPPVRRGRGKKEAAAPGATGDQAPKKRGRKPKNAVEGAPAADAPVAEPAKAAPAGASAKQPAAAGKQKAVPPAAAKNSASAKAAPAKATAKPAAKKPAPKKPEPKKAAPKKKPAAKKPGKKK
jgi:hypothetical protein